jgi:hypothetical protein
MKTFPHFTLQRGHKTDARLLMVSGFPHFIVDVAKNRQLLKPKTEGTSLLVQ